MRHSSMMFAVLFAVLMAMVALTACGVATGEEGLELTDPVPELPRAEQAHL